MNASFTPPAIVIDRLVVDLTVAQLAEAAGTQEHRLRRLVNTTLGYRNFAEFLNARRIEAAKAALADPARADAAISTIGFELGYASLGPFNRAFRDGTGTTPTAWRRARSPSARSRSPSACPTATPTRRPRSVGWVIP